MKHASLIIFAALAACNSGPSVTAENASIAEVAKKAQEASRIEPGEWKTSVEIVDITLPGSADPRIADAMKRAMSTQGQSGRSFSYCVTPEQAEKPSAELFAGKDNGDCRFDNFSMTGGKMESKMSCSRGGGTMVMSMSGTYSPTAYAMTADMETQPPQGSGTPGPIRMKMKTNATRVGDCAKKG